LDVDLGVVLVLFSGGVVVGGVWCEEGGFVCWFLFGGFFFCLSVWFLVVVGGGWCVLVVAVVLYSGRVRDCEWLGSFAVKTRWRVLGALGCVWDVWWRWGCWFLFGGGCWVRVFSRC